jgi:short-subunit dehydrogenase
MPSHRLKPLREQVIVITGATSGIGLTTAEMAARKGASLFLISRNEDALKSVAHRLRKMGAEADYAVADVGEARQVEAAAEACVRRFGRIDTWVNDAGVGAYARLEDLSESDHRRMFETNYWGVVNGSLTAVRRMRHTGGGALINIGSIASDIATPVLSAYAASKHAVKGFTDSLRMELLHDRAPIQVTLIKPSGIETPFGEHARNYMDSASKVPPPVYHPRTVAQAVLYAAENPTRSLTVGGAGVLMTLMSMIAPMLADRIYASSFFKLAKDNRKPPQMNDGLHHSAVDTPKKLGGQSIDRSFSLWTTMRTHPRLSMALAGAALVVLMAANREEDDRTAIAAE